MMDIKKLIDSAKKLVMKNKIASAAVAIVVVLVVLYFVKPEIFEPLFGKKSEDFTSPQGSPYPEVFTMYKVDWCPHCKKAAPAWEKMAEAVKDMDLDVKVEMVDGDEEPEKVKAADVKGFPTMIYKKGNDEVRYEGPRDTAALVEFVKDMAANPAPSERPSLPPSLMPEEALPSEMAEPLPPVESAIAL